MRTLDAEELERYREYLVETEKSEATIEKYIRDIKSFEQWKQGNFEVTKEVVIEYKNYLREHYKTASASSMLEAVNRYFQWLGWENVCVKGIKSQRQMFSYEKELTMDEYRKMVEMARQEGKEQLALLMETIAGTGMRISELPSVTVEAVVLGWAEVLGKGKCRQIYLPKELRRRLEQFCQEKGIQKGSVFISKHGNPLNRSNVWKQLKHISEKAGVDSEKAFPHNFRHLFARTYYKKYKDIVYLADILGHASIDTTRIYTKTACESHVEMIESLGLIN